MAKTSNKLGVQQLTEAFLSYGIKHIVFSPGSRNAPLVLAFANDERFSCFVIPDERSAGFYALGIAEESQNPVAVMCTSGSALLNYYPAVSEAFYRNIPLIVVSADRPSEWIDQGDGQTIRQENVFQNHICKYASLLESPQNDTQKWVNQRLINESILKAKSLGGGPVHLNFPFTEPLYESTEIPENSTFKSLGLFNSMVQLTSVQEAEIQEVWNKAQRKLILVGQMPRNDYLNEQLRKLAEDKSVAIVVENTSNLQDRSFVHCIDRTISSFIEDNPELYRPDLLITLGGAIISKKIKSYLRKYKPQHHWKVGAEFPLMDTYQSLSISIPMNVNDFANVLLKNDTSNYPSRYGEQWKQLDYLTRGEHDDFLENCPYSDLSVFHFILDSVPDKSNLHISNSSTIRYAQLFDPIRTISYFCNRGTSGIDGSMSTALGATLASGEEKINTLIIGDMSFFYDSNAFWNQHLPTNFRVFLINNGGGGIFNIIPGPDQTPNKDDFFVTQHSYSAKAICEAFNVNYFSAKSLAEIDQQIDTFYDVLPNERPAVMEIFTDNIESSQVLKEYFKAIKVVDVPVLVM